MNPTFSSAQPLSFFFFFFELETEKESGAVGGSRRQKGRFEVMGEELRAI